MVDASGNGQQRLSRAQKNEEAYKAHNERRARFEEAGGVPPDEPVPFACECDDPSCSRPVQLSLSEYERAVAAPDRFMVLPGHEDPTVERIVDQHPRYLIVSKPSLKRR